MTKRTKKSVFPGSDVLDQVMQDYDKTKGVISGPYQITPEFASVLLKEHNPHNRPISKANVKELKQKIEDGSYEFNGEPLIIDTDMNLTNGQHTLTACVEVGKPIEKLVVIGVSPTTFATLDQGKNRKLDDVLAVQGEDHARELAVALRLLFIMENGKKVRNMGKFHHSKAQEFLVQHPALQDSVQFVLDLETPVGQLISPGYAAALHYLMTVAADGDEALELKVEQFWKDTVEMDGVSKNSPAWRLNNRLGKHKIDKEQKLTRDALVEHVVKAWCLYRDGEELKRPLNVPKAEVGTWFIGGLHVQQEEDE